MQCAIAKQWIMSSLVMVLVLRLLKTSTYQRRFFRVSEAMLQFLLGQAFTRPEDLLP